MRQSNQEQPELNDDRLVEAKLSIDARDVGVARAFAQKGRRGIARQKAHQHERRDSDQEQGRDQLHQPRQDPTRIEQFPLP